ncbi:MAG TPA: hypothetical protein VHQ03_05590, partial [Candidatus Dormibacteraeota bacterium]|nr:hypothetical protein [Candidatus Dormibacteraeota bacterium]
MSLILAGLLTFVLVRDVEFQSVQDQLDRQVMPAASVVKIHECRIPQSATASCQLATPEEFTQRLSVTAARLGGRLLLLDGTRYVVYDSGATDTLGRQIPVTQSARFSNVFEARTTIDGDSYIAAAIRLPTNSKHGDPLGASYVVLAQPQSLVVSAAAGDIAKRLLEAGGVALVAAMLLILLVSRSVTGPLTKLAAAAEDIA